MSTRFAEVAATSAAVAQVRGRLQKRDRLAALLRALAPDERRPAVAWLTGTMRQGKIGVGYAELGRLTVPPAELAALTIADVDAALDAIAACAGRGATARRRELVTGLFARATADEQAFLARVLGGELRQGGLDGVMTDAVAAAAGVEAGRVRRAAMLAGDLPSMAALALAEPSALDRVAPRIGTPIEPMLASPSGGLEEAIRALAVDGAALVEWKLDGARVQVHKDGDDVRVFTRALKDVTASVPEAVELARALPADRLILDGEAIALHPDGRPRPFQETQARFAKKSEVAAARAATPLSVFFFDAILIGEALLDRPLVERRAALARLLPAAHQLPSLQTTELAPARAFLDDALARGHEGVMVKALASPYQAGARGAAWQKVKPVHTLDLVVLAAEWGSGRRHGTLSNLHLGARDPDGGFVMLGKTFKGLTDELLAWQTAALLERQIAREGHVVRVRPELVVEIAFDGVQQSPTYAGGLALRFARVVRYRPDKPAHQADTIDQVRAIFTRARSGPVAG